MQTIHYHSLRIPEAGSGRFSFSLDCRGWVIKNWGPIVVPGLTGNVPLLASIFEVTHPICYAAYSFYPYERANVACVPHTCNILATVTSAAFEAEEWRVDA